MWLFTTRGFFSIVQKWDEPDAVQVRARIREDLDALRQLCPELGETKQLPGTDYPYRAITSKAAFAGALSVLVLEHLDYTNFKSEVEKKQGRPREELYARVWSVMFNAEEKLKPLALDEGPADLAWTPIEKQHDEELESFATRGLNAQRVVDLATTVAPKQTRKPKRQKARTKVKAKKKKHR